MSQIQRYLHKTTSFWVGFSDRARRGGRGRNPRQHVFRWCLALTMLLSLVKFVVLVFFWINITDVITILVLYSSHDFLTRLYAVRRLFAAFTVLAPLQVVNFLIVWPRKNHGARRSALVVAGDLLLIALTTVQSSLIESTIAVAPSAEDDLSAAALEVFARSFHGFTWSFMALVSLDAAVHASAMAFWHWLLPPVWRFPNHFEPVVREDGRKRVPGVRPGEDDSPVELAELSSLSCQTSLAAHFRDQEKLRARASRAEGEVGTCIGT